MAKTHFGQRKKRNDQRGGARVGGGRPRRGANSSSVFDRRDEHFRGRALEVGKLVLKKLGAKCTRTEVERGCVERWIDNGEVIEEDYEEASMLRLNEVNRALDSFAVWRMIDRSWYERVAKTIKFHTCARTGLRRISWKQSYSAWQQMRERESRRRSVGAYGALAGNPYPWMRRPKVDLKAHRREKLRTPGFSQALEEANNADGGAMDAFEEYLMRKCTS